MQAVFQHVKGVERAICGYTDGSKANVVYELVSTGTTGHAESVLNEGGGGQSMPKFRVFQQTASSLSCKV